MKANAFYELLYSRMLYSGKFHKNITVEIPGVGAALIKDIVWHNDCNEFHIILRTVVASSTGIITQ